MLYFNSNFILGYNVTILAYGQTGSGKTHSMGTNFVDENEEEKGIIPRAIQNIFNEVQKKAEEAKFSIKASFIEVFLKIIYLSSLIILLDSLLVKNCVVICKFMVVICPKYTFCACSKPM